MTSAEHDIELPVVEIYKQILEEEEHIIKEELRLSYRHESVAYAYITPELIIKQLKFGRF